MSNADNYVLGMDCGTTNIKAIILGDDGTVVASTSKASTFMLPVDDEGRPVRNALTYQDGRSADNLRYIVDTIGFDNFVQIVGGQPSVAFLPNKILWFKENEPELFAKTRKFLQASSYINYKLTGKMTSDIDQATRTQCLDIRTMSWSKEIGDAIGVDFDEMLPELKLVDEIIGFVTEEAAKETGLREGIPVIAGCSDAMASVYALGMSRLGEMGEIYEIADLILDHVAHGANGGAASSHTASLGKKYVGCNFVVCHIVGGEGPVAPTRCGSISVAGLLKYVQDKDLKDIKSLCTKNGGFVNHAGISDALELTTRAKEGDKYDEMLWNTMIYQIAKCIGSIAAVLHGKMDGTGYRLSRRI